MRSLKLTPGRSKQLLTALDTLAPHVDAAAEVWPLLTDEQRDALLAHSTVLSRFVDLARRLDTWQR